MSRAGAGERGFTLIELLATLTIVALMAAIAMPRLQALLRPGIDRTTQRVALAIRDQRSIAIRTGRIVTINASSVAPLLPAGTVVAEAALGEQGLSFFPTGASTGGRLVLEAGDGRRAVSVDWLTGRVTVGPAP
jgi:general secretion pathway protein H